MFYSLNVAREVCDRKPISLPVDDQVNASISATSTNSATNPTATIKKQATHQYKSANLDPLAFYCVCNGI